MRRLHYADVACAARAVMQVAASERWSFCAMLIRQAQAAEEHRLATGRSHPSWGSGSLMEVARDHPLAPEPGFDDDAFRAALRIVLACLRKHALSQMRS